MAGGGGKRTQKRGDQLRDRMGANKDHVRTATRRRYWLVKDAQNCRHKTEATAAGDLIAVKRRGERGIEKHKAEVQELW